MNAEEWKTLIRALEDVDDVDRMVAAAAILHKTANPEDLPRLMDLLNHEDFFVREAAAWPISELAGPNALLQLLTAYQRGFDQGHDNDGFSAALMDLAECNKGETRKALQELMSTGDNMLRKNAEWLLEFCDEGTDA